MLFSDRSGIQCAILEAPEIDFNVKPQEDDVLEQESTHQVPCGSYSIFDVEISKSVTEFERAVYLVINEHSNWELGISHALSYQKLADLLNVRHRSQVIRAVKSLIDKGWLRVEAQRKSDGANIYKITHHLCKPEDIPLDRDNRIQKCAVPSGEGSPTRQLEEKKIDWRVMVDWFVKKINSDWVTGIVEMTVREANNLVRFSRQTICDNARKMAESGLVRRISAKFRASVFQLIPKPYAERRERAECKGPRPLPKIQGWFYSYNKRWRFHEDTLELMMEEPGGRWRYTNMEELYAINPKIHRAFKEYMYHWQKILLNREWLRQQAQQ